MTDDGKCDNVINSRIAMEKNSLDRYANEDAIAQGICTVSDVV